MDPTSWSSLAAFSGYERWLARLSSHLASHPRLSPSDAAHVLGTAVEFRSQKSRIKAGLDATDVDGSYADLCARGTVPMREGDLHDLLNALVWARFPFAKRALHERQVRLARARHVGADPRKRSRDQDSCAMLDEGGLLIGRTTAAYFGHAALMDVVEHRTPRPFILHLDDDDLDHALAVRLRDEAELPRVRERRLLQLAVTHGIPSITATSDVVDTDAAGF